MCKKQTQDNYRQHMGKKQDQPLKKTLISEKKPPNNFWTQNLNKNHTYDNLVDPGIFGIESIEVETVKYYSINSFTIIFLLIISQKRVA